MSWQKYWVAFRPRVYSHLSLLIYEKFTIYQQKTALHLHYTVSHCMWLGDTHGSALRQMLQALVTYKLRGKTFFLVLLLLAVLLLLLLMFISRHFIYTCTLTTSGCRRQIVHFFFPLNIHKLHFEFFCFPHWSLPFLLFIFYSFFVTQRLCNSK